MVFTVKLGYLGSLITFLIFVKKKKTKKQKKDLFVGGCGCDTVLYASLILPRFTWLTCTHILNRLKTNSIHLTVRAK